MKERSDSQKALRFLGLTLLAGLVSVVVYAISVGAHGGFLTIISVGILLAGGASFIGGTVGFLFGIPRTLQQDGNNTAVETTSNVTENGKKTRLIEYRVNTNLEQISDWLTKILVGVGLTQINSIKQGLISLTAFAAKGLGSPAFGQVFAFTLIAYFTVLGFLFGYLWTRLFLAGALRVADQSALGALAAEVEKVTAKAAIADKKIDELKKQTELDAAALNLAYRQLNPSPGLPAVTQSALNEAVMAASRPVRVQVFNQAWEIRSKNWRTDKPKMEMTIPVFRALIHSDVDDKFHMNHGQLGFALREMVKPDWVEAEKALSKAIELRGSWTENGWLFYEYNRAYCRIMQDPSFAKEEPSRPELREQISEDLKAATHASEIGKLIKTEPVVKKWMSINKTA